MRLILIAFLLAASPAAAAAPRPAPARHRMTQAEQAAVQQALDRGTLIYAYDQAAWHGTDDLRAKLPDFRSKVDGWIVDGPADAPEIVFYDRSKTDPKAVYVARFEGRRIVSSRVLGPADDRTLSASRSALIAARRAAFAALVGKKATPCSRQPFNTVVLPPESGTSSTLVYFLTPQTRLDAIPIGGHYRLEIGPDGRPGKLRAFTKACMEMPLKSLGGDAVTALVVSHLLDPTPTEIHVFSSLAAHLPIFVLTTSNKAMWAVEGTRIRTVDR
jgi:hypothetical protein